ncbi:phage tail terminator-like protein [Pseudomonas sp. MH9.3]|uniref:phage tail terminator-like protein n=1 Tax=Pseudomonas sp. MH9.3 TaxID=3048630 RepID=UPI002AC9D09F|nr:phage tail terminator-like protein [Pseudomonas sp. MH9.3]MEB0106129.1 phage tail terminator-like protein [Pseudomonas sp. MH9.3]WPX80427.1 phage tail terminator-like protein [Pseudomonas sp. MH9.3]WQG57638.1 phage tail terminator-like protein [Pseudomonas sp. RTB3]
MSHAIIASIYEAKLIAWNAARPEKLKIVFENTAYAPAEGETYLSAFTIPGDTASNTLGGDHRLYTGVFQVSIIAPAGTGKTKTNPIAADIIALFPLYVRDVKNGFVVTPMTPVDVGPGITGDYAYTVPLSFSYRSDTTS